MPVALHECGGFPPVAASWKGAIGVSTTPVLLPGAVTETGATPAPGCIAVWTVKSAPLTSVSAPAALRATEVVLEGDGAADAPSLIAAEPNPTKSITAGSVTAVFPAPSASMP